MNAYSLPSFEYFRQRRSALLVIGVLVAVLQLWAGLGIMPRAGAGRIVVGEICTANGPLTIQLPARTGDDGVPRDEHKVHACCTYCSVGAPLLFLSGAFAATQMPAFSGRILWSDSAAIRPAGRYRSPPSQAPPYF